MDYYFQGESEAPPSHRGSGRYHEKRQIYQYLATIDGHTEEFYCTDLLELKNLLGDRVKDVQKITLFMPVDLPVTLLTEK